MSASEFEHPIFHDDGDQVAMLAAILDSLPAQSGAPAGTRVPLHPRLRLSWAKELIEHRGVVVVPSRMERLPMPTGDHPEAGWMQPVEWVKAKEYRRRRSADLAAAKATAEAGGDSVSPAAQQEAQMKDALRAIRPSTLQRIESLTNPEERAAMAAELYPQAVEAVNAVRAALDQIDRTQEKEGEPNA